jgi:hypothetical protein
MGQFLKINGQDFSFLVSSLKIGYETLVSDNSGRNANGDTVIDVINKKCKVYVGLRHTTQEEMKSFLAAIENYVVEVSFRDAKTNSTKTITAYTGTPEPDYYTIQDNMILYKPLSLNFIEL